jgi:Mg2+ and Co2+ transporter CorA
MTMGIGSGALVAGLFGMNVRLLPLRVPGFHTGPRNFS